MKRCIYWQRIRGGSELPFTLESTRMIGVVPVGADAQLEVRERLTSDYLPHFVTNLPLRWSACSPFNAMTTSDIVRRIVDLLLQPQHDALLANALHSTNRRVRREIARIALGLDGEHLRRVVDHGLSSDDSAIRLWCSRTGPFLCLRGSSALEVSISSSSDPFMPVGREAMLVDADTFPEDQQEDVWKAGLLRFQFIATGIGTNPIRQARRRPACRPLSPGR